MIYRQVGGKTLILVWIRFDLNFFNPTHDEIMQYIRGIQAGLKKANML
jgi:hypothetical protein